MQWDESFPTMMLVINNYNEDDQVGRNAKVVYAKRRIAEMRGVNEFVAQGAMAEKAISTVTNSAATLASQAATAHRI